MLDVNNVLKDIKPISKSIITSIFFKLDSLFIISSLPLDSKLIRYKSLININNLPEYWLWDTNVNNGNIIEVIINELLNLL